MEFHSGTTVGTKILFAGFNTQVWAFDGTTDTISAVSGYTIASRYQMAATTIRYNGDEIALFGGGQAVASTYVNSKSFIHSFSSSMMTSLAVQLVHL
jgi:hypothetical protein